MAHARTMVLVVEDETLVRMAISDYLEEAGFTVLEARNSDEALKILVNNLDVRLVFTDVDMPGGMDGLKLASAIRERWPPIKIVVTSGHRTVRTEDLPVEAQFFSKPYDARKVTEALWSMTADV